MLNAIFVCDENIQTYVKLQMSMVCLALHINYISTVKIKTYYKNTDYYHAYICTCTCLFSSVCKFCLTLLLSLWLLLCIKY